MNAGVEELPVSEDLEIKKIVGQVAAAYFGNSHVTPGEIAVIIGQIASSLAAVGSPPPETPAQAPDEKKLTPAQIRKSITRDAIISFEDNKPYKTMRRHLASQGLTPDDYRSKWGLPRDYPMVAPSYSEARSSLAKARGLGGRVRPSTASAPSAAQDTPPIVAAASTTEPAALREPAATSSEATAPAPAQSRKSRSGQRKRAAADATTAPAVRAAKSPARVGRGAKRGPGRARRPKSPVSGAAPTE